MMPRKGQTTEQYLAELEEVSGANAPRATPEQIEVLKALGYVVEDCAKYHEECAGTFQWVLNRDEFQQDEPSYSEADAWACAQQYAENQAGREAP